MRLFPTGTSQFGHLLHHLNEPQGCWLERTWTGFQTPGTFPGDVGGHAAG